MQMDMIFSLNLSRREHGLKWIPLLDQIPIEAVI